MMRVTSGTLAFLLFAVIACQKVDVDYVPATVAASDAGGQSIEDTVRTLEQDWADAVRTRDSTALERLVAPNFTVSSDGTTDPPLPRAIWMTNTLHNLRVDSIRLSPAQVTVRGDTATATLVFFWAGQFKTTPPFRDSTTLTDTWVRRPGEWQVHRRVLAK